METFRRLLPPKHRHRSTIEHSLASLVSRPEMIEANIQTVQELLTANLETIDVSVFMEWAKHHETRLVYGCVLLRSHPLLSTFQCHHAQVITRERTIRPFAAQIKHRSACVAFRGLYEATRGFETLANSTQRELMKRCNCIKNQYRISASVVRDCLRVLLQHYALPHDQLDELYAQMYTATTVDFFRDRSEWHATIIQGMLDKHQARLSRTSAAPAETIKTHMSHEVRVLDLIDQYAKTHRDSNLRSFLRAASIDDIVEVICVTSDSVQFANDRVKSRHAKHHAASHVTYALSALRAIPEIGCFDQLYALKPTHILALITDLREVPGVSLRRHFLEDEIVRLFRACVKDTRFTLMLRMLKEVGLRINALVSLRVGDVLKKDGEPKQQTSIRDKGNRTRTLVFGNLLRSNIQAYVLDRGVTTENMHAYLFPSSVESSKHISMNQVRKQLRKYADRCGIHGVHVHPHAFRHTLVNKLVGLGNDLQKVSRFIGHTHTSTTEMYYWTTTVNDTIQDMEIPWLRTHRDTPLERAQSITLLCVGLLSREQRMQLRELVPDIEMIVDRYRGCGSITVECSSDDEDLKNREEFFPEH